MKHTKNSGGVVLKTSQTYTILREDYKGQHLLLIKGIHPAQRWVDVSCFSEEKRLPTFQLESPIQRHATAKQNLLALSWHNAFCETHRHKRECKRKFPLKKEHYSDTRFVIHGLWPQPRNNIYCNVSKALVAVDKRGEWRDLPCLALDREVEDELEKVMPGFLSELHKHEWIKHGTCYGTGVNQYYKDTISLTKQVNDSVLGDFFENNIGKVITLDQVRAVADKAFGRGAGKRLELRCKGRLITELWLHLGSGGDDLKTLLHKGKVTKSRCKRGHLDRVGFN